MQESFFDHLEYMEEKYGAIIKFDGTLLDDIVNPCGRFTTMHNKVNPVGN